MNKIITICLTFLIIFIFTGCSFLDLKEDLDEQNKLAMIEGTVFVKNKNSSNIVIGLIKINNNYPSLTNYTIIKKEGEFSFIVEPGLYKLIAYLDSNDNLKYDIDELVTNSKNLDIKQGKINIELNIDSLADKSFLDEVILIKKNGTKNLTRGRLSLGKVVRLDSDIFSDKNVKMGLWQSYEFIKTVDFGLFFLEKYNPNKKIVLFVHGINGSPRNFESIINGLDHSKFQPFILYYPSGVSISMVSIYTKEIVEILQAELKFKKVSIVAHSMGGLTAKKYLDLLAIENDELIDTFISISTPWNGHAAANSGLKYSPLIIPVWRDMATNSDFISTLFETPLPSFTKYYLLFGYKGSSRTVDGNSDGVVSIKSQLRLDAQKEATLIRGFNENHNSILKNKELIILVNKLLEKEL